jgi:DNA-binding beta-propeller fold protein YncE
MLVLTTVAHGHALQRIGTIQVPGTSSRHPFELFDGGIVLVGRDLYILSDISNQSIDVFRASTGEFLFRIPGFFGFRAPCCDEVGPGSLAMVGANELWATDAQSRIRIVDLTARRITETIDTGGHFRTDSLAYDPVDHVMLVVNPDEPVPFVTLISTRGDHRVLGRVKFPEASAELEEAVWSPETKLYYEAIPELRGNHARGAVAVIDPRVRAVVRIIPVEDCGPNAVVLGPRNQLLIGCRGAALGKHYGFPAQTYLMNLKSEKLSVVHGVNGSDQVDYDPGDSQYYLAAAGNPGGPVLAAISAGIGHSILLAPSQRAAHSVVVDPLNGHVYVPFGSTPGEADCLHGCIALYSGR